MKIKQIRIYNQLRGQGYHFNRSSSSSSINQPIEMDAQKRIKELMEERGWTDYCLAKEANPSHSTVTNMFNRNNAPTLPTLESVCRASGITLAQFFA